MEQHVTKKSKRMWTVMVSIKVMGSELLKYGKVKTVRREKDYIVEYCHPAVTKFFKKGNMLHIKEGKKEHIYDGSRIIVIQVREHKRSGIQ